MKRLGWIPAVVFAVMAVSVASGAQSPQYAFDVQHSKMTVYVYKRGLFSFLADDHQIDAPIASGSYDAAANSVEVTVDAAKMKALDPKLAPDRRATVQSNMTGPQVLDVAKYPTIAFHSTKIETVDASHETVTGNLTLHGQTHPVVLQVVKNDAMHFTGFATVRQTSFGITPIKIAGGAVSVRDDVRVEFEIALAP
jgi:polyisoprenoid-binding protein YceI